MNQLLQLVKSHQGIFKILIELIIIPFVIYSFRYLFKYYTRYKQRRKLEIRQQRNELIYVLEAIIKNDNSEQLNKAIQILRDFGLLKKISFSGRANITGVLSIFLNRLKDGNYIFKLRKNDAINRLQQELKKLITPYSFDSTGANVSIGPSGELIEEGYQGENGDLENEMIRRIQQQLTQWSEKYSNQLSLSKRRGVRILLIGGMRINFAYKIIATIFQDLNCQIIVCIHQNSWSLLIDQVEDYYKTDPNINIHRVYDESASERDGYDVIVCTHYWQHRPLADFSNAKFHLKDDGGLLIWCSAVSRGSEENDMECVCEGMKPMEPNPVDDSDYSIEYTLPDFHLITYTPMDGFSSEKAKLYYSSLDEGVWGGKLFYDSFFPKIYLADKELLNSSFCKITLDFLKWYFSDQKNVKIVNVQITTSSISNSDAKLRFNVDCYYVCNVDYYLNDIFYQQEFIVEIGVANENNKCTVALYPSASDGWNAEKLDIYDLSILLTENRFSDQFEEKCRNYYCCDDQKKVYVIKNMIKCPVAKHYLFFLDVVGGKLHRTCLPSRRYIPKELYDTTRTLLVKYDERIEKLLEHDPPPDFLPCRSDSVTILRPYLEIKRVLKMYYKINIDELSVFFHKCYGYVTDEDVKLLKLDLPSESLKALKDISINIRKDIAFNTLPLANRLKMLGGMNVHDVLMFGVKSHDDI